MDEYRIESQKLIYHPQRVSDWLLGKDIYPIYMEITPYGGCNHRCIFCGLDYLGYKACRLDTKILKGFIKDIAARGVKSIMFAGEGEPLLNKDLASLVKYAKKNGLDVAITTNGVLLTKHISGQILSSLSWLRISLNAGSAKTYSLIHRTKQNDFNKVINNIKEAVRLKKKMGYACTIGVQFLLLNENYNEVEKVAKILRDIGADYLIIKPYSQHPLSINRLKSKLDYKRLLSLEESLKKYKREDFRIIFRKHTMSKITQPRPYRKCLGLPFWAYLASNGDLYACSSFLGEERFRYGNINKATFSKIWKGKKRKAIRKMMKSKWNIDECREVCRLDEVNRYLWRLKHPPEHVNFV
ncbi:MAG: radical SAM protein [Candidatus Omnitrophica bacterium]|nr:radical SAM protein [Candidatus Omnitrophota bacterium]